MEVTRRKPSSQDKTKCPARQSKREGLHSHTLKKKHPRSSLDREKPIKSSQVIYLLLTQDLKMSELLTSLARRSIPSHPDVRLAANQYRTRYNTTHTPTYHRADQQSPNILVARNAAPTLENYDINTRHLRGNRRRRKIWAFPPSAHTHPRHCALFMC
jgi:hypothetical protein